MNKEIISDKCSLKILSDLNEYIDISMDDVRKSYLEHEFLGVKGENQKANNKGDETL